MRAGAGGGGLVKKLRRRCASGAVNAEHIYLDAVALHGIEVSGAMSFTNNSCVRIPNDAS
jgi:hypothetical protein